MTRIAVLGVALVIAAVLGGWAWQEGRNGGSSQDSRSSRLPAQAAPEAATVPTILPAPATLDGSPVTARGERWEAAASDRLADEFGSAVLAVRYDAASVDGFDNEVRVLSTRTGDELGRVRSSWGVMAVMRDSAREILVADVLPATGARDRRQRLLVLDAGRGLSLKREFSLEWRAEYIVFAQKMRLSPDQRLLYYLTYTAPESSWGMRILNLDNPGAPVLYAQLPRTCGFAYFDATAAGAAVACRDGNLLVVSPGGAVTPRGSALSADAERDPSGRLFPWAQLSAAFLREDGTVVAVAATGEIVEIDTTGAVRPRGGAFPKGLEVGSEGVSRRGDTATIGFWERGGSRSGVAIVDLVSGTVVGTVRTANAWAFALRLPNMTLYQDGPSIVALADTGQATAFAAPGIDPIVTGWALTR